MRNRLCKYIKLTGSEQAKAEVKLKIMQKIEMDFFMVISHFIYQRTLKD